MKTGTGDAFDPNKILWCKNCSLKLIDWLEHNLLSIICYWQIPVNNRHCPQIGLPSHIKIKAFSVGWDQKMTYNIVQIRK
jgi:hypothetical protein